MDIDGTEHGLNALARCNTIVSGLIQLLIRIVSYSLPPQLVHWQHLWKQMARTLSRESHVAWLYLAVSLDREI